MTRSFKKTALGVSAAALLMGATSLSANASYLGYGNGDPGNWDFWAEQNHGIDPDVAQAPPMPQHTHRHTAVAHHHVHHYRGPASRQSPEDKS